MQYINKLLPVFLLVIICCCFAACNRNTPVSSETQKQIDLAKVQEEMLASVSTLPPMSEIGSSDENAEDNFPYLAEMDYDLVDSFFFSYSSKGLADEIAVIVLKDAKDVSTAKNALEEHHNDRMKIFREYEPDQAKRGDNYIIFSKDNYVVFAMCDDTNAVKNAFYSSIE